MFNCSFSIFFKIKSKTRNSLVIYFPPEIDVKIFFDINPVWIRKQESMKVGGGGSVPITVPSKLSKMFFVEQHPHLPTPNPKLTI